MYGENSPMYVFATIKRQKKISPNILIQNQSIVVIKVSRTPNFILCLVVVFSKQKGSSD